MRTTITAPRVLTGGGDLGPGWVQIEGTQVSALGAGTPPCPPDLQLPTGVLAPGLVDLQANGAFGSDFADAQPQDWARIMQTMPSTGVTALAPTFVTAPIPHLAASLRELAALRPQLAALPGAARILPAHVEGPFLAERRRGAHKLEYLSDPTPAAVDTLIEAGADGVLGYVTLAPEREGALEAVVRLVGAGVRVSVGHTDATEDIVHAAAEAGATLVTHLYNAQRPLRHRDPGVVGAALVDDRLTCGLIVDGHHVMPAAVRVAFASKPGQIMLVTDAVAALGMPQGRYVLGGEEIIVREGQPPRRADGTIAGAAGRLDDAIGLAVVAGIPLRTAVEAATRIPADAIGRPDLGRLVVGGPADLVWLTADATHPLRAHATWIDGALAHHTELLAPQPVG